MDPYGYDDGVGSVRALQLARISVSAKASTGPSLDDQPYLWDRDRVERSADLADVSSRYPGGETRAPHWDYNGRGYYQRFEERPDAGRLDRYLHERGAIAGETVRSMFRLPEDMPYRLAQEVPLAAFRRSARGGTTCALVTKGYETADRPSKVRMTLRDVAPEAGGYRKMSPDEWTQQMDELKTMAGLLKKRKPETEAPKPSSPVSGNVSPRSI